MRRVLVTGASGAIGSALLPALRHSGWQIRALTHRHAVFAADEEAAADLRDPLSLRRAAADADAILHLAGLTHARRSRDYFSVNAEGTRNLIGAVDRDRLNRFVLISSRAATTGGGAYAESKLRAEEIVRDSGLPHCILRLPEVYGAGGSEGVDEILARAHRGAPIPIPGTGSQRICPVHLGDLIKPIVGGLDVEVAIGKTYTLSGDCMTVREFAQACIDANNSRSRIVPIPLALVRALSGLAAILPLPFVPDQLKRLQSTKREDAGDAQRDLGFAPMRLQETPG